MVRAAQSRIPLLQPAANTTPALRRRACTRNGVVARRPLVAGIICVVELHRGLTPWGCGQSLLFHQTPHQFLGYFNGMPRHRGCGRHNDDCFRRNQPWCRAPEETYPPECGGRSMSCEPRLSAPAEGRHAGVPILRSLGPKRGFSCGSMWQEPPCQGVGFSKYDASGGLPRPFSPEPPHFMRDYKGPRRRPASQHRCDCLAQIFRSTPSLPREKPRPPLPSAWYGADPFRKF